MKDRIHKTIKTSCWVLCTLISLFLYGCATAPDFPLTTQQPDSWQYTLKQITNVDEWGISGKIGVRVPESIDSAVINRWQQTGDHFTIDLSSVIFGLGSTTISGTPNKITITESGEAPIISYHPERLIEHHIGWPLPLAQLRYWIKGIPAPDSPHDTNDLQFNTQGHLSQLTQDGWQIGYSRHRIVEGINLPGKIVMKQQQTKITVVVNEWLLP